MRLPVSVACLSLIAAAPASAQPQTPVSEALVDRFIHALPHQEEFDIKPRIDERDLARLSALNPGREPEIRAILTTNANCSTPALKEATMRVLRATARTLGTDRLGKLVAFYEGADGQAFVRLADASHKGRTLSAADKKEMDRIKAAYPLDDWAQAMNGAGAIMQGDEVFLRAITNCAIEQESALARAKLRTE